MIRLTLAQMRKSVGRLTAAGIAIAIGTAFVAATLIAGATISRTSTDAIAASYAQSDLVVVRPGMSIPGTTIDKIAAVEGVDAIAPKYDVSLQLQTADRDLWATVVATSPDPRLNAQVVASGRLPESDGEVALPAEIAERLKVAVGDTVAAPPTVIDTSDGAEAPASETLTVVGLLDDPNGAYAFEGGAVMATTSDVVRWAVAWSGDEGTPYASAVGVALASSADPDAVAARIDGLGEDRGDLVVRTRAEHARVLAAQITGDANTITYVVLAFAALALVVAGLVIANTFQVLVAQRTRTLALLRCVGANKRQLRASVLVEATILGVVASLTGIAAGVAAAQATLSILATRDLGVPLPGVVPLSAAVFAVPLVAGLAVTVIAATSPARAATRVAPLAALRPADAPSVRHGSKARLVTAIVLSLVGFGMLALGIVLGTVGSEPGFGLLVGIPGGALSFVGVAVGAVYWIPAVTAWVGSAISGAGPSARLATANTLRNPRRTAATSTALLIGVTLVAMMTTGAMSARQTFNATFDERYAVDVMIEGGSMWNGEERAGTQLGPDIVADITAVEGVAAVTPVVAADVEVPDLAWTTDGDVVPRAEAPDGDPVMLSSTLGVDLAGVTPVLRDQSAIAGLTDDTVLLEGDWSYYGFTDGQSLRIAGADGAERTVTVRLGDDDGRYSQMSMLTAATLSAVSPDATTEALWIKIANPEEPHGPVSDIQSIVDDLGVWTSGPVLERAMFDQMIDALLAVVVGLLAVAVFIALIGVTNTLSLSVLERQRENAMLRAIGLTRRQLRTTLAIEGLLIAVVGTALGALLGLLYGWAGSATVLGSFGDMRLAVPWRDLGLVLGAAVAAGLVASVIPARRATRTSPVEALAVD